MMMRTTLDIDDDVLAAAKERARRERKTTGRVVSELLRRAMTQGDAATPGAVAEPAAHYGFRPFASRGVVVSDELVERLRDEEGI
jgi:hypothetical protein